eukprot:COSAG02_NODE_129_length_34796_cov_26.576015_23_plen_43_part_00
MEAVRSGPVPCGIHAEGLSAYKTGIVTDPDGGKTSDDQFVRI